MGRSRFTFSGSGKAFGSMEAVIYNMFRGILHQRESGGTCQVDHQPLSRLDMGLFVAIADSRRRSNVAVEHYGRLHPRPLHEAVDRVSKYLLLMVRNGVVRTNGVSSRQLQACLLRQAF